MSAPERRSGSSVKPRFGHPKVLAIDLPKAAVAALAAAGFNVRAGTFGAPRPVQRSRQPHPVPFTAALPNASEQEIVIVDPAAPSRSQEPVPSSLAASADLWQRTRAAQVEPRLAMMAAYREDFDRIYSHGGVFIVFAVPQISMPFIYAPGGDPSYGSEETYTNWGFLAALAELQIRADEGEEIEPAAGLDPPLARALAGDARFDAVIEPYSSATSRWFSLAESKYGKSVAGILVPAKESADGFVVVLPRIKDKGAVLCELLTNLLPSLAPKLFPEDERQAWAQDDLYAPHGVAALRAEISSVRGAAEARAGELETQIETLRAEASRLRELLTATGPELVAAVKTTLESLGFADIRDVDETEGVKEGRLREDLQIHTNSPIVLCEVKGINGLPRDEDALEVVKYILPRIKEWDRTDVRGLTIVNHQRGLPPSDRDPNVFQGDQVQNAEGQDVGLLTAFDLFRLARGYARNGWRHEDIAPLFTASAGRVPALPLHYTPVGEVHNYLPDKGVVIVELTEDTAVAVGERLAFVGPVEFAEQEITSLQFEDEQRQVSPEAGRIGLKTALAKDEVRKGAPVYLVGAGAPAAAS